MTVYVAGVDGMTSHDAADVTRLETVFLTAEGVVGVTGDDLLVEAQSTPDMTVKVSAGSCFVLRDAHSNNDNTLKFWHVVLTAETNVTITTADPSNPRIDLICVKVDTGATPDATASNVGSLVAVAGTPAGTPSAPSVPNNHLKIAEIEVDASASSITSGDITDYRTFIGLQIPYSGGYRLKDTGANLDAHLYEDSTGNVILKASKSGGQVYLDQINNKVMSKGKSGDTAVRLDHLKALEFIIDNGTSAITTGEKGHLEVPFDCSVEGWTILADQSGSIVVDVWKDTYANYPPTVADTIAGSEKPTLSTAVKNQDLALSTWTTSLSKGDILAFNVDSVATIQRVTISLLVRPI